MKRLFLGLLLIISILYLSGKIFGTSFAYSYEIDNSVLFYKDDYDALADDIKVYLGYIDDYIISNSSFLYADELSGNYDFLVNFALDYVIYNIDNYSESIVVYDDCRYIDRLGLESVTSNYVDIGVIYEITNKYFGIKDFSVINDNVCMVNNYISLSDYTSDKFELNIDNVVVSGSDSDIVAEVVYDSGDKYLYIFFIDNNVLKLKDVEVL